jgi:hypothetical protein
MSDLADAVFGGQLLGHVIAGQELTASVITDAAMNADLASSLFVDKDLSFAAGKIIQSKVAENVIVDGHYDPAQIIGDHLESELLADGQSLYYG